MMSVDSNGDNFREICRKCDLFHDLAWERSSIIFIWLLTEKCCTNLTGMASATPDNETCYARFPLPNPPPEGGGADESLREFHVKPNEPGPRMKNGLFVGWAKRSVPNISTEKLMAMHPNYAFIRWARYTLPNLRTYHSTYGQPQNSCHVLRLFKL
jgi:hypothetical protein